MADIHCYGVHWAPGNIAFLHQDQKRGATNAIGLRDPSPFNLIGVARRRPCPHLIPVAVSNPAREHMGAFRELIHEDALARFLLPLPGGGVRVLRTRVDQDVTTLLTLFLKMGSPIRTPMRWAGFQTRRELADELEVTNLLPWVLLGVKPPHTTLVQEVADHARLQPRKLLLVADPDVPLDGVEEVQTRSLRLGASGGRVAEIAALPLEALGATVVRAFMRREWGGTWFTKEPTPANEPKPFRPVRIPAG